MPATTMPTTPLANGAANAVAYSAWPSSARDTSGITVVTAIDSKATSTIIANAPMVVVTYGADQTVSGLAGAATVGSGVLLTSEL